MFSKKKKKKAYQSYVNIKARQSDQSKRTKSLSTSHWTFQGSNLTIIHPAKPQQPNHWLQHHITVCKQTLYTLLYRPLTIGFCCHFKAVKIYSTASLIHPPYRVEHLLQHPKYKNLFVYYALQGLSKFDASRSGLATQGWAKQKNGEGQRNWVIVGWRVEWND